MLTSLSTTRLISTRGGSGGDDFFWAHPAHRSVPKRLNTRALCNRNKTFDPFTPFLSLPGSHSDALELIPKNVKSQARSHCVKRHSMRRFRKMLYLMAANFDALRVRAVASADFDGDRL